MKSQTKIILRAKATILLLREAKLQEIRKLKWKHNQTRGPEKS